MHKELLNYYFIVVGDRNQAMKLFKKGKRLNGYNNYLLWISRWIFLLRVGFHLRADI